MKKVYNIFVVFLLLIAGISCSTKKDTFVSRNYHAVSTKYNVLFNGNEAFLDGLAALNNNYEDDYWELLPIEPIKIDELAIPGITDIDNSPQEFERAEEKAVKAIQKHSMLIAREERNSQIDASYLLLGKSRYYTKRFVPALEAFNYIIINYPRANLIDETRVWQAKTHIRLQNTDLAVETLTILLNKESLSSTNREAANTTIAMAYAKMDSVHKVIYHLNQATLTSNNKEQTARNLFILGQLYHNKHELDSSDIAFQKVIDLKKAPYRYKIHAEIEQAKNAESDEDQDLMVEELQNLIRNRDNRDYFDEIYYRLGEISNDNDTDLAIAYYKASLKNNVSNNFQKELSYEAVGNLLFDKANFNAAGAYYDSVLQIAKDPNSKRIRRLTKKRNNLDDVILYGSIAKRNDSILNIVAMSKDEQKDFFNEHIEKIKAEDKLKKELEEIQKMNAGGAFFGSNSNTGGTSENGKWYFYNTQTAGFGQQQFRNIWGNRPLEDNWRLSDKIKLISNKATDVTTVEALDQSKKYEVSYYLDQIPTDEAKIDSISVERNEAYYKLGNIYLSQFKEIELATSTLEELLTFNPKKDIALPTNYRLYKIYGDIPNKEKEAFYKSEITTTYPTSKYARKILNPIEFNNEDRSYSPESIYAEVFYEFKDECYDDVINKADKAVTQYEDMPIAAKFELLKAYAIGKKEGLVAFKEALNFVVKNYPNTNEEKKATEVIATLVTKIK